MCDSQGMTPYAPDYVSAAPAGPWLRFFAWRPRRLYDGRLIWLRHGWRQIMVVHEYLFPGGGDKFWRYTDHAKDGTRL